jgi:4a-hydroxytetrahydrobiopterin dehydratase
VAATPEGWDEVDNALERTFEFPSYLGGAEFVGSVAQAAEQADHHPDLLLTWRKVKVRWSTHSAGGVTDRDRELAQTTNELYSDSARSG